MDIRTRSSWGEKNSERDRWRVVRLELLLVRPGWMGNGGPAQVPEGPAGQAMIMIIIIKI